MVQEVEINHVELTVENVGVIVGEVSYLAKTSKK
jgi:hypothetical protein